MFIMLFFEKHLLLLCICTHDHYFVFVLGYYFENNITSTMF